MARTIKEIQDSIITSLSDEGVVLSDSKTSEGRLWSFVVATAIHLFEVVLDVFKTEVSQMADKITGGTARWYAAQCRRWQNGDELLFNSETTELYYAKDNPELRLIDVVAITAGAILSIKVAKIQESKIVPLTPDEIYNFIGYIESIKFMGDDIECISTFADEVKYIADVYHTPTIPRTTIEANVKKAIDNFRKTLDFDSMFYRQRFIDAIMRVDGVVTVDLKGLERKGALEVTFIPIDVMSELKAGYFNFTDDSDFECKLVK